MYAYAHSTLDEKTIKLTNFASRDKLFAFIRVSMDLKDYQTFFTKQMSSFFKTLIEQGFALVYIDDIYYFQTLKDICFYLLNNSML